MATRRRYTKIQKAEAVGLAMVVGQREAARTLGMDPAQVNRWWHDPDYATYRNAKSEDLADAFQVGMFVGLHRMLTLIPSETDLGKLNAVTGTLYDKFALVTGAATSRSEHRDIAVADPDATAVRKLQERLGLVPASGPVDVVIGGNGTYTNGKH